jgi:DNA-binding XRE family transcriptional regulator
MQYNLLGTALTYSMLTRSANLASTALAQNFGLDCQCPELQTVASEPVTERVSISTAISELYRFSGLTWDEMASLFKVDRQTLFFWEGGDHMAPNDEEHLWNLRRVIQKIDRGASDRNRVLLVSKKDGNLPLALLTEREYDRVIALLGPGPGREIIPYSKITSEIAARLAPPPPAVLLQARYDPVAPPCGRIISATPIKFFPDR